MTPSSRVLELRHLRTLLGLAEGGSLARAAERLHLTQSALSHQIKGLEHAFGLALFERDVRPLRATEAGKRLLTLARSVLPQVADAERDLLRYAEGAAGTLRVAVECHTCFDWLMPAMDTLRERWPEVELDLVSGFQSDAGQLLSRDAADLVVVHDSPPLGVMAHFLFRYPVVAVLSPRHPLAARSSLAPEDFLGETLITYPVADDMLDVVRHFLAPAGVHPERRTAELTPAILQLVASRRGIAALPEWTLGHYRDKGYVVSRPLGPAGLHCELYAATTESMGERAYVQEFVELIRQGASTG